MKKLFVLLVILFTQTKQQIKENPLFLVESKNPFLLSTNDDYFYLITIGKNLKIEKDSGNIEDNTENNILTEDDYIFIADYLYNNYIYFSNRFYHIIYNPFISYENIRINDKQEYMHYKIVGLISINNNSDFITYGYYNDYVMFSTNFKYYSNLYTSNLMNYKLICKYIKDEIFVCGIIFDSKFNLYCLKNYIYPIEPNDSSKNFLSVFGNNYIYNISSSFGLYDTDKNNIKIFCIQNTIF